MKDPLNASGGFTDAEVILGVGNEREVEVLAVDGDQHGRVDDLSAADEWNVFGLGVGKRLGVKLADDFVVLLDQQLHQDSRSQAEPNGGWEEDGTGGRLHRELDVP